MSPRPAPGRNVVSLQPQSERSDDELVQAIAAGEPWAAAMLLDRYGSLPFVRGDIGWDIHPVLALRAQALSGIAVPRPVIRLPGRSNVSFGRPLLAFSLVLEAGIW
ncbi:hypothetical protein [Sorangium sp. So ce1000]|uniref:hypothetical protein n=1 Tax=Sorangium sp. So ce1000 TaxID=3133325 RepID=UPI003F5E2B7A